ncbi:MAG: hypothetical protein U5O39_14255 [Gammaproteobacteria bacterium]|nr:hypothetical protein [Gammaproteobacteria bacterium]
MNLFSADAALRDAVEAAGGEKHVDRIEAFGERCGAAETAEWARRLLQ